MGVNIGGINIPFVSTFSVDKSSKPTEQIKHLGNVPPHMAEFQADVLKFIMDGTLFQASGDVRDVDQYAEDITALVERFGVYNYIDDYQNRSGWLIIDSGDSDKSADSVLIRNYSLGGLFMPKNKYQARMHTAPTILTNDFSLTLGADGCDNYVPIPIGATFSGGDDATITRTGQDGAVTLVKATTNKDITWDLAADEVDVGECKVWDDMNEAAEADWIQVFNPDHVFTGDCVVENGFIRVFDANKKNPVPYGYRSSAWEILDTGIYIDELLSGNSITAIRNFQLTEITQDKVVYERNVYYLTGSTYTNETITYTMHRGSVLIGKAASSTLTYFKLTDGGLRFVYADTDIVRDNDFASSDSAINDNFCVMFDSADNFLTYLFTTKGALYDSSEDALGLKSMAGQEFGMYVHPFTCSKLFEECEDMTQGAGVAYFTGADASPKTGNTGSILNAQNENIYYEFTGGTDLPLGTYKLFLRAKDSAQVADDISCLVRNTTDSTDVMAETKKTLTGSWAYYAFDVTIASDDDTDTIRVTLNKETATANIIDLDYVLWVPITLDSGNGPQDIAHQAMCDQNLNRELIAR